MAIKLVLIGINSSGAQELETVVTNTLGNLVETTKTTLKEAALSYSGDMYVCFVNRYEELCAQLGAERVIPLEMRAPATFFIQVARIPVGENVVIFNNSLSGAKVMLQYFQEYKLTHVEFSIAAFEEIATETTRQMLSKAKYIVGNAGYTAPGKTLYTDYGQVLKPDAQVLPERQHQSQ